MQILYSGFDTIDFSIQGALPPKVLDSLAEAKSEAEKRQGVVLINAGPGDIQIHVHESGMGGGFAFRISTGPTGEIIGIKKNTDPQQWNITVSIRAAALASYGWQQAVQNAWDRLHGLGARIIRHSIRRVDYAMDIHLPVWDLRQGSFVTHARSTVQTYRNGPTPDAGTQGDEYTVHKGDRIATVMIGKMPGRQIIVYDKRAASIVKREYFWFEAWGLPRDTPDLEIMRVELRAGKTELTNRWRIKTFTDFENSIGDVFERLTSDIRYIAPGQTDSNVTRQRLDPIWILVKEHLANNLLEMRSGLTPDQVKEIEREEAKRNYQALIVGNGIGYAVAAGLSEKDAGNMLPSLLAEAGSVALRDNPEKILKSMRKTTERLHFIAET